MKNGRLSNLASRDGTRTVLASIVSILIGLVVGAIIVLIVGLTSDNLSLTSAWEGIRLIFGGIFSTGRDSAGALTFGFNPTNLGNMLFRATPLIMTGLSVAVAYKTGLFNIGAPGQYLMGTMASLMLALGIPSTVVPAWIIWIIAFLGGILAGALWGAIPGMLKALLNINEVIACIMTNWIAANVVTWAFEISNFKNLVESTKSSYIYKTTFNGVETPKLGLDLLFPNSQVNGGIIIAILIAVLMYVVMNKTTLGYELKACGSNRHAARYAGINDKTQHHPLHGHSRRALRCGRSPLLPRGQHGVPSGAPTPPCPRRASTASPSPCSLPTTPSAWSSPGIFMSMLDIAGLQLTSLTAYNEYITDVIIAVIVYLSAFSLVIKMLISGRKKKKHAAAADAAASGSAPAEAATSAGDDGPAEEPLPPGEGPGEDTEAETGKGGVEA